MKTAIYPGSFDPITLGHLNIIRRASGIFDRVVVCIMPNAGKRHPMFTREERVGARAPASSAAFPMWRWTRSTACSPNTPRLSRRVRSSSRACARTRTLKTSFRWRSQQKDQPELDTMFLTASQKYTFLSSSVVKELASYGADLTPFVPCEIIDDVHERAKCRE